MVKIITKILSFSGEIDLAFPKDPVGSYKGFITLIDCFNRFCWTMPIKNKTKPELTRQLTKLFKKSNTHMDVISSDGEFEYMRDFFTKNGMHLKTKVKGQHAMLVENAIRNIKRRLALMMRTAKSSNWKQYIQGNFDIKFLTF